MNKGAETKYLIDTYLQEVVPLVEGLASLNDERLRGVVLFLLTEADTRVDPAIFPHTVALIKELQRVADRRPEALMGFRKQLGNLAKSVMSSSATRAGVVETVNEVAWDVYNATEPRDEDLMMAEGQAFIEWQAVGRFMTEVRLKRILVRLKGIIEGEGE